MMNFSMSETMRKQTFAKIESENNKIAQRLFHTQSDCQKKVFDKDYRQTLKYKKLIRRVEPPQV